ncbi:tail assembly chaperone [Gordonia phage Schmidt]|uniref:Tail assembly chaperone n=1 Tax=Gordonia phage Schmidt TaxID=2301697 RepID=A0A385E356_9CAUD|nr:tail assembly chaperone [Gordonia phage Schmidt]AXQ65139.1 tail assembly chaperone [Gordonia phage Schmidt]
MIKWLPPVNARAAAQNDGVWWSDLHALINLLEFRIRENTAQIAVLGGGKPKDQKHNPKPWKRPEDTLGDTGGRSVAEVMAYLESIAPPKRTKDSTG